MIDTPRVASEKRFIIQINILITFGMSIGGCFIGGVLDELMGKGSVFIGLSVLGIMGLILWNIFRAIVTKSQERAQHVASIFVILLIGILPACWAGIFAYQGASDLVRMLMKPH